MISWLSSHWLAGAFVDYDFGNRDNDSRIAAIGPFTDIHVSNGNNHAWSIGGRLGFSVEPEHAFVRLRRLDSNLRSKATSLCHGW